MHKLKAHKENIKNVKIAKYLGDILNTKGTIDDTIADRRNKGIGKISQISIIVVHFDVLELRKNRKLRCSEVHLMHEVHEVQ